MKDLILHQFRTFRALKGLFVSLLLLTQTVVIVLLILANTNLRLVYRESLDDNVKLLLENYVLKKTCGVNNAPKAGSGDDEAVPQKPETGTLQKI